MQQARNRELVDIIIGSAPAHTDDVWPLGFDGTRVPTCVNDRVEDERSMADKFGVAATFHVVEPLSDTIGEELAAWPTRTLGLDVEDGSSVRVVSDSMDDDVSSSLMWVKKTGLY